MAFSPVILQPSLELEPGSYVLFWLKRTSNGRSTPVHAGIITINELTSVDSSTRVLLQEWPLNYSNSNGHAADPMQPSVGAATLNLAAAANEANMLLLGWRNSGEPGITPDRDKIYSAAWDILSVAARSVTGGVHRVLWRMWPSWKENYAPRRHSFRYVGSCGGFVQFCFTKGGLTLVDFTDDEPESLPGLTVEDCRVLDAVLPLTNTAEEGGVASDDEILQHGLDNFGGVPPWHLFLPGYLLAAFIEPQYPFRVRSADDCFLPI